MGGRPQIVGREAREKKKITIWRDHVSHILVRNTVLYKKKKGESSRWANITGIIDDTLS